MKVSIEKHISIDICDDRRVEIIGTYWDIIVDEDFIDRFEDYAEALRLLSRLEHPPKSERC